MSSYEYIYTLTVSTCAGLEVVGTGLTTLQLNTLMRQWEVKCNAMFFNREN